ncbi:helix-turn-helix transcriptional regulator [Dyella acidiphila]|uniref:AlpA family phage regulatory protein n=1 Tax=Dyella acidiphila TaxID=2775866 RepID=A0ABR9GFK5_9GAMM|nr:AlpA family phage regulatory protein [Dyella acidiphila]MBE1162801.1 AlpA family phage regulatory protein [Dyella acidiphila]
MSKIEDSNSVSLLRMADVVKKTGLSRSTVGRLIAKGQFPSPIKISGLMTRWLSRDVDTWIFDLAEASSAIRWKRGATIEKQSIS